MTTEEILRNNLTSDQYDAVVDDSKNILCLACAGSGKSRTLAYKIAYLVSKGESPDSIIAFTFTEKAAESIKRRVAYALSQGSRPYGTDAGEQAGCSIPFRDTHYIISTALT